jgi:hypothetical protein
LLPQASTAGRIPKTTKEEEQSPLLLSCSKADPFLSDGRRLPKNRRLSFRHRGNHPNFHHSQSCCVSPHHYRRRRAHCSRH